MFENEAAPIPNIGLIFISFIAASRISFRVTSNPWYPLSENSRIIFSGNKEYDRKKEKMSMYLQKEKNEYVNVLVLLLLLVYALYDNWHYDDQKD